MSEHTPLKGVVISQLPVNLNDATTGHKLQGMSKDQLIMVSWSFMQNWTYVVLSCVRTLGGLYLLRPLTNNCLDKIVVPKDLERFEDRMYALEAAMLAIRKRNMQATGQ